MQVDFDRVLTNLDGLTLSDETKTELTLGRACAAALVASQAGDVTLPDHILRYKLALRVIKGRAELSVEECALIRERLAKQFATPMIVGQAALMLDGADDK